MGKIKDPREEIPKEVMGQCKILYCEKDLPMTRTCMCWGWECGPGWYGVLKDLSYSLEVLNIMFYEKYKCRIQADQVKEKFGTLRFYHSVHCDSYTPRGLELKKVIDDFERKVDSGYFGIQRIVEHPGSSEEVDDAGKKRTVWHPPVVRTVATKNAEEYAASKEAVDKAYQEMVELGSVEPTDEQRVIMGYLDSTAERMISDAENACYNVCENCGRAIGTKESPRRTTSGWIRYICDGCFNKSKEKVEKKDGE